MEKKKHPILKGILIGTAVVIAILAIHFMRNYVIISQIAEKQAKLQEKQNYYYLTEHINDSEAELVVVEFYYKDGKHKKVLDAGENRKITIWVDEETKEAISLFPHAKLAIFSEDAYATKGVIPCFINNFIPSYILGSFITNDIIDGKECYKINLSGAKTYIDKSDGTVLKSINGKVIIQNEEYDSITIYRDWKFGELTDEDLARPNLTGYEVKNNEE